MFYISKKTQDEIKALKAENLRLHQQLTQQELVYRQWENLLQYGGKPQSNNLERELSNE